MQRMLVLSLALLGGCSDAQSPSEICNRLVQCIGKVAPSGAAAAVQSYGPSSPCWANSSTATTCTNACQSSYQTSYSDQCGCNQDSDCDQATCDPSTHQCIHACSLSSGVDPCPSAMACDPKQGRCVSGAACQSDAQCAGGYACLANCAVNCALNGAPADVKCASGYKCGADFTCAQAAACTFGDDTPCGAYKCDADNHCKLSCNGDSDCASGVSCSLNTRQCG